MSGSVWKFDRSVSETIEKLSDVIQCTSTAQIKMEWSYRAQVVMEPAGWDALWRIPRDMCHKLGVRYPCVVYVTILELHLDVCSGGENEYDDSVEDGELYAGVSVVGVQDDNIHLPETHDRVPIAQLWPTLRQPNKAIDVQYTADFIDLYRYFYSYIWLPWDLEWEESCGPWFQVNVPARVAMWAHCGADRHHLTSIRDEALATQRTILRHQMQLPSDTEDDLDLTGEAVSELMSLHERMQQLKAQWMTFQNPTIHKQCNNDHLPPQNISVWPGGSVDSYITHLREVNKRLMATCEDTDTVTIQCSPSLEDALKSSPPKGSTLFLPPGEHDMPRDNTVGREYKVLCIGSDVSLVCREERSAGLCVVGGLTLDGANISAGDCSTVLSLRSGDVTLRHCRLSASTSVTSQAIIVFGGVDLKMSKCKFDGFFTGIMVHKGAKVVMDECVFEGCDVSIQACSGSMVVVEACTLSHAKEAAIRYDTHHTEHSTEGGVDLLAHYSKDISCNDCRFIENKCDVYVAKQNDHSKPEWETDHDVPE